MLACLKAILGRILPNSLDATSSKATYNLKLLLFNLNSFVFRALKLYFIFLKEVIKYFLKNVNIYMQFISIEPIYLINDKNHIFSPRQADRPYFKLVFGIILKEMKIF